VGYGNTMWDWRFDQKWRLQVAKDRGRSSASFWMRRPVVTYDEKGSAFLVGLGPMTRILADGSAMSASDPTPASLPPSRDLSLVSFAGFTKNREWQFWVDREKGLSIVQSATGKPVALPTSFLEGIRGAAFAATPHLLFVLDASGGLHRIDLRSLEVKAITDTNSQSMKY
jgi:hypothetical protein